MKMKNCFLVMLCLIIISCNDEFQNSPFKTTEIYTGKYRELMNAANDEDLQRMDKVFQINKLDLNYADSANGLSLLNWCIISDKKKSFEELLKLGANPNWQDTSGFFAPAITEAAKLYTSYYLKTALRYGGNPNQVSQNINGPNNQTPLLASTDPFDYESGYMDNMKILVNSGAHVNLTSDGYCSPLMETLVQEKIEMSLYLLEHGADYNAKLKTVSGEEVGALALLREILFPLGSKLHRTKMKVVAFLKQRGLDYWKEPIPPKVLKEFANDREYLSKY